MLASYKFIHKLWELHKKIRENINEKIPASKKDEILSKFVNHLIHKVNGNLEKFNYNVIIANMYEAYNYLNQKNNINVGSKNLFENYSKVLTIFSPIIPHYCSECMDDLKIKTDNKWPEVNYKLLEEQEVNIVIQINSKKRGIIVAKKDIEEEDVLKLVYKDEEIKKFLENKQITKNFYVKNRLINILVK